MKLRNVFVWIVMLGSMVSAQSGRGALSGSVRLPDGPVARATVQATHVATGAVFTAISASSGQFDFRDLPAGAYEVSVPGTGISTTRFVQQNVMVETGKPATLNIVLQKANQGVLGDDNGYLAIHNKYHKRARPGSAHAGWPARSHWHVERQRGSRIRTGFAAAMGR